MSQNCFKWAVVGAGPAGIAAVGKLLDEGIKPSELLWIDPYFEVGDLGRYWKNASSNTKAKLFVSFLKELKAFSYDSIQHQFALTELDPEDTCLLKAVTDPLQSITRALKSKVSHLQDTVEAMSLQQNQWHITTTDSHCKANQVILATGCDPKPAPYTTPDTIAIEKAIDKNILSTQVSRHNTIAVFGSSHSAIMIAQHLVEIGVQKIINFYRSPCKYAVEMDDWILFDNTGLKGKTARWAKAHIDGKHPDNLERYLSTEEALRQHLPRCDKAIYAIGFEPRNTPKIKGLSGLKHNTRTGIIAPGLFGFGIGFPEAKADPYGNLEMQIGLWKFMTYLKRVMPLWLRYTA